MSPTNLTFATIRITIIFIFCFSNIAGLQDETCTSETLSRCNPQPELLWKATKNTQRIDQENRFRNMVRVPQKGDHNPSTWRISSERREFERRFNPNNRERNIKQDSRERYNVQNIRNRVSQELLVDSQRRIEQEQLSRLQRISNSLPDFKSTRILRNRESQEFLIDSQRRTKQEQLSRFRRISNSLPDFKSTRTLRNRESQELLIDSQRRTKQEQLSRFRRISNSLPDFRSIGSLRERQISRNIIRRDVPQVAERSTDHERVRRVADTRMNLRDTVRDSRRVVTTRRLVHRNSLDNRTFQKHSLFRNEAIPLLTNKNIREHSKRIITREQTSASVKKAQTITRTISNERTNIVRSDRNTRRTLDERNAGILTKDRRMEDSADSLRRVRVEYRREIHNRNRETSRTSAIPSARTDRRQQIITNENSRNTNDRRIISREAVTTATVNNLNFRNNARKAVNHHGQFVDENNNILKHSINWTHLLTSTLGGLLVIHTILISHSKKGIGSPGFALFQNLIKTKID